MMHFWSMNMGWGGMFFPFVPWVVLIAAAVVAVWYVAGRGRNDGARQHGESAMDILEKRYARGEIDEEEFGRKKRNLVG